MERGQIEQLLRQYKTKKSLVESADARIKAWDHARVNPDIILENYYSMDSREPGMPGSPNRNIASPQERILTERELTSNTLLDWIKEEESRIFHTKLEVTQIESALNALTQQERFIIECKYFEGMNWRSIENNVNSKYREVNYITEAGIRKINSKALDKIKIVLDSFYDNLHIA